MDSVFVGEIRVFACNFAPAGWAQCNGQLLSISQNTALFSLLGNYYGGDGRNTFALPNIQGRGTINTGQGPGLSPRELGESAGSTTVMLTPPSMPMHTHFPAANSGASTTNPGGALWSNPSGRPAPNAFATPMGIMQPMSSQAIGLAGGNLAHNNLMPYQTLNYCIALQGVFPQRP